MLSLHTPRYQPMCDFQGWIKSISMLIVVQWILATNIQGRNWLVSEITVHEDNQTIRESAWDKRSTPGLFNFPWLSINITVKPVEWNKYPQNECHDMCTARLGRDYLSGNKNCVEEKLVPSHLHHFNICRKESTVYKCHSSSEFN